MLKYVELKEKPKEFLAATGLTEAEFQCLLTNFEVCYQELPGPKSKSVKKKRKRKAGGGRHAKLSSSSDKLFFILVFHKTAPLQTMHGLAFGLSQPQTNHWIHRLLPVLQQALSKMGMNPEREGRKVGESLAAVEGGANLSIDGTERRLPRPVNTDQQKQKYSGKKKTHTDKNILLVNENTKKVVYLSATTEGKKHDKKLAEESKISYPRNAALTKDTAFQSYEPKGVLTAQPKKKWEAVNWA